MKRTANEFRLTFANGTEKLVVGRVAREVANAYEVDDANPLTQVQRTRINLEVLTEDPVAVAAFAVEVYPEAAADGGCKATPTAYEVPEGTEVIFQAIAADGYQFSGWYKGASVVSNNAIAKIPVTGTPGGVTTYQARFVAVA